MKDLTGNSGCFNSLMVRLKVSAQNNDILLDDTFQFLDGAIKRSFGVNPDYSFVAFQFLDGAIKSVISIIIKRRVYHVSIP